MINIESRTAKIVRFIFLGIWLIIYLFPLYWIAITSLKPAGAVFRYPLQYRHAQFSLETYINIFSNATFGGFMINSLIAALAAGVIATLISILASYVLARFEFRNKTA